jgi:hypothetical protein
MVVFNGPDWAFNNKSHIKAMGASQTSRREGKVNFDRSCLKTLCDKEVKPCHVKTLLKHH